MRKGTGQRRVPRLWISSALVGAGVGLLWAWLYDAESAETVGLVILHALVAVMVAASAHFLTRNRPIAAETLSGIALGATLGILWVTPIALFLLDFRYYDVHVDVMGFVAVVLIGAVSMVVGALVGGKAARSGLPAGLGVLFLFGLFAWGLSYFLLGRPPAPNVTIENRLGGERVAVDRDAPPRVMVLGVDGGSWNVLLPMLREGRLPHVKSLMEKGSYGTLEPVLSDSGGAASPVVWTSIFTGTRPAKHGIRDWLLSDSRNRRRKALWNILNDQGGRAIVVNVPGTFPPEVVEGAMISGFPIPGVVSPESERFQVAAGRVYSTRPQDFHAVPSTLLTLSDCAPSDDTGESSSCPLEVNIPIVANLERRYGKLRHAAYDLRMGNLFLELAERRGHFQTRVLVRLHGLLVDTLDDDHTSYDTLRLYRQRGDADALAVLSEGEWSDWLSIRYGDVNLAIKLRALEVSARRVDLYATPIFQSSADPVVPYTYPLNLGARLSSRLGQYVVEGAGWTIFENEALLDPLYEHLAEIGAQHADASLTLLDAVSDWSLFVHVFTESDRVQHSFWPFLEPDAFGEVDATLVSVHHEKIAAILESIDRRIGEFLARAGENTVVAIVSDHGFRADPEAGRGDHSMEGVYIFSGPGVRRGELNLELPLEDFPRASVVDVAPTLLYLMGYPTAEDLDGRVLVEIADDEMRARPTPDPIESYETGPAWDEREQTLDDTTIEQLRSLGYVQ